MPMSIGGKFRHGGDRVIHLRHERPSLWHAGLAKDIEDLWEPWMREADRLLEDAALVESVYEAQGKRHPQSRSRGRAQTPAEVALRLLILKHVRNWSYDTLEREVRANLVYRAFTRIGDEKVPDAKTLARLGQVIGPEVIRNLHQRLMELARERGIVEGAALVESVYEAQGKRHPQSRPRGRAQTLQQPICLPHPGFPQILDVFRQSRMPQTRSLVPQMDHSIASVTKFASDTHRHLLARTQPPSHTKHTSFFTIFATESS